MSKNADLKNARPGLRLVSPQTYWITQVYGGFNITLGLSFLLAIDQQRVTASLLIVNNIFTYKFWGIVFILLGILQIYSLFSNRWGLTRKTLLAGVAVKSAWMLALVFRAAVSPGTVLVATIWLALALIQVVTVIFFIPNFGGGSRKDEGK